MTRGNGESGLFGSLTDRALELGASTAQILAADMLRVEERWAESCAAPHRCPSYGLAPGCPPHAMPPASFRRELEQYRYILVFKVDVPAADLLGEKRLDAARAIHRIASGLERAARSQGMVRARGMAAGSCKELFCGKETACTVLAEQQPCRHHDLARPSISAVGVDFAALAHHLGWKFGRIDSETTPAGEPAMGLMAGLVLLD